MVIYGGNVSHATGAVLIESCTEYDTVSVCGAAGAVVPADRAAVALETTAPGEGLSLMLCQILTLPNHIALLFLCHSH